MDPLYLLAQFRRVARLQRQATIVAGLASRRSDGRIDAASLVREARLLDTEIIKQSAAEVE